MKNQRIVIFVNNINFIILGIISCRYLQKKHNLNTIFFFDSDIFNLLDTDIVIPIGIGASKVCYNLKVKNCLVNSVEIYNTLNFKSLCYLYSEKLGIKNIPTFVNLENSIEKLSIFIEHNKKYSGKVLAKQLRGAASTQIFIYDEIELKKTYKRFMLTDYIIQPYLDITKIITIDCICYNGKIIDSIFEEKHIFYNGEKFFKMNNNSWRRFLAKDSPHCDKIFLDATRVAENLNFNGMLELEYCVTKKGDLYFLEINPRICWVALTYIGNTSPYFDRILIGYINLCLRNIKIRNTVNTVNTMDNINNLKEINGINYLKEINGINYQSKINRIIYLIVYAILFGILYLLYFILKR